MTKKKLVDFFGWGLFLWFIGYLLGIVFFMVIPHDLIGFAIMPIGIVITLWVLLTKINNKPYSYFIQIAATWTAIAILFDYLFIVKMFNAGNGYYKMDIYIYYLLTCIIPLVVGGYNSKKIKRV
jgi:hypothetical protein